MGRSAGRISVHTFPTADVVLAERVREIIEDVGDVRTDALITAMSERLQAVYPAAKVQLQSGLAGLGTMDTIYVFRDGGVRQGDGPESWIEDSSAARLVSDAAGRYVDANEAAARLLGIERSGIIGRKVGDFTRPDVRIKDPAALWRALESTGRLHSLAVIVRTDDAPTRVEFLTIRDGVGPGRNVTYLRAID